MKMMMHMGNHSGDCLILPRHINDNDIKYVQSDKLIITSLVMEIDMTDARTADRQSRGCS